MGPKKQVRLIEEGSVLFAPSLRGRAVDVAPDGFAHPVYRAGFALAVAAPPEPIMRQAPAAAPEPEAEPETIEQQPAPPVAEESEAELLEAEVEMEAEGGIPELETPDPSEPDSEPHAPAEPRRTPRPKSNGPTARRNLLDRIRSRARGRSNRTPGGGS